MAYSRAEPQPVEIIVGGVPVNPAQQANFTYTLANAVASLAAGAGTTPVTGIHSGSYIFDAQFGGTTPSLKLQVLGADGVTWRDVGTALSAAGQEGVVIGEGASARLFNAGGNAITNLYGTLT